MEVKSFHTRARAESGDAKLKWIQSHCRDKRKVILVSRYLSTIKEYAPILAKERQVFVVTGATPDQEGVIQEARESFESYLLVQADLSAGWEAPEFQHLIFISIPFSVRSLVQMRGRNLRINKLQSTWTTFLLGGPLDTKVWQRVCVDLQDFTL